MYQNPAPLLSVLALLFAAVCAQAAAPASKHMQENVAMQESGTPNPAIDMPGYLRIASEAARYRAPRRANVADFVRMSQEPGTIVLDARSAQKFALMHVKGAINLSFPDIDVNSLAQVLPDKNARILIYCNNNFENDQQAFPTKTARASLNLSTYIALYTYGYRNVYELAPLLDAKNPGLELVSGS
jgi:hypothetical protein